MASEFRLIEGTDGWYNWSRDEFDYAEVEADLAAPDAISAAKLLFSQAVIYDREAPVMLYQCRFRASVKEGCDVFLHLGAHNDQTTEERGYLIIKEKSVWYKQHGRGRRELVYLRNSPAGSPGAVLRHFMAGAYRDTTGRALGIRTSPAATNGT